MTSTIALKDKTEELNEEAEELNNEVEDILAYLPNRPAQPLAKREALPLSGLYLVVDGSVKISNLGPGGQETCIELYFGGELFGDLADGKCPCRIVALENASVMIWTPKDIEGMLAIHPQAALLLVQALGENERRLVRHLCVMTKAATAGRVQQMLYGLAKRTGKRDGKGGVRLGPLTHQVIADYVGTSREIVTSHMNVLRRKKVLQYSRSALTIDMKAMRLTGKP